MNYTALQVKTCYSILASLNKISNLVSKAVTLGYTSLAITDTNNMFGVYEFYLECKKNNIKPIIGIELEIENKKILLYAKNKKGYRNLIKLSTLISDRDLTKEDLIYYKDDLVLIMPFLFYDEEIYNIYIDKYVGYSNIDEKNKINEPKVLINDVCYLENNDYSYIDYLDMIKQGKILGEYELNTHIGKHLLTKEEVNLLSDREDILNTKKIVDMCNVEIEYTPNLLPIYDQDINAYEYLTMLCNKGLKKRLNNKVNEEYQKRLDYELEVINQMGFCNYFLIVWDYVKYAKFNNILVGPGRGSAAGSLVSYTLGITEIDPLKYDLLFERFLNPERITMPDIDIDFDAEKREQMIEYVTNKYGDKKVVGIITFNTLGAKQVIRDVGRVMDISLPLIDELSKTVGNEDLKTSFKTNDKFKRLVTSSNELKKLYDIAIHLEGLPRHISIHAAGIVMSRNDIDEVIPLYKNQLGQYTTAFSMNYLEQLGLLKMDFLGLSNLTLIDEIITNIRKDEGINITFEKIPLDDKKTLEIFKKVETDGIFQFESTGMRRFLKKLQIDSFEDVSLALALYRPGPMDNIDSFIARRNKKETIDYLHPDLEPILKSTNGIIIYQEQIMQIARTLAGYSYGETDLLRRAMSKKKEEILIKERPKFIQKSIEKGYSKDIANQVFDLILKFANYGFNKSHSISYAVIAYKMAFLKTYFYKHFVTSVLNNSINSDLKSKIYILEARSKNIKILSPSINESNNKYYTCSEGIRCPLSIIRNVGTVIANDIIKEREKGLFLSFTDFIKRMYSVGINKKVLISLIQAGCFTENKKTLINNLDNLINYAELSKNNGLIEVEVPEITVYQEYSKEELAQLEYDIFGFYLSEHPINRYKKIDDLNTLDIYEYFNKNITLILEIDSINEVTTKNNDVMAFVKASDECSSISLTLFPNIYEQYNDISKKDIIKVKGKVEKRFDKYQIIVNSLEILKTYK